MEVDDTAAPTIPKIEEPDEPEPEIAVNLPPLPALDEAIPDAPAIDAPAPARPRSRSTKGSSKAPVSSGSSKSAAGSTKEKKAPKQQQPKVEDLGFEFEEENKRSLRGRSAKKPPVDQDLEELLAEEVEDDEGGDEGVTRCVCGEDNEELSNSLMIQCDTCKCWQHGPCVGLWKDADCPDRYFCELCRPGWHGPGGLLRKAHRKVPSTTAPHHARSPSASGTSASKSKPRESADAALVAAFLAAESSLPPNATTPELEAHVQQHAMPKSPSASNQQQPEKAPKKRSTMNSRDAAYDDAIAMSILGPGSAAMRARLERAKEGSVTSGNEGGERDDEEGEEEAHHEEPHGVAVEEHAQEGLPTEASAAHASKKRRTSDDGAAVTTAEDGVEPVGEVVPQRDETEVESLKETPVASTVPSRPQTPVEIVVDEVETPALPAIPDTSKEPTPPPAINAPPRAKHPNQYTYRPKNGPAVARAPRASPVKRGHGVDGVRNQRTRDWTPQESHGWGLPDHLKHLAHLLPSPAPLPIAVPVSSKSSESSSSSTNSVAGPSHGAVSSPTLETHLEAPTRVRFPNKRMTMPEMKKRARNVMDYLARIQIEMSDRERRQEYLSAAVAANNANKNATSSSSSSGVNSGTPTPGSTSGNATPSAGIDALAEGLKQAASVTSSVESMAMMDSLTKDIILFQQKYFGSLD
ncbi:hypothetical protein MNV49_006139 [Pseudohyphozyma bogoriensis]|nr:hypothetical protein MNV49_006139 [Pseudohyphozyma bogoriensis]